MIRPISTGNPEPALLSEAAETIRKGGLVAFPTDTFYGLAVNPFDSDAVARLYKIKKRSLSKPILLLIADMDMLEALVEPLSPLARKVMKKFWPGPLTIILKAKKCLPEILTAGTGNVGIRFPDAVFPIRLIREVGFPLTASSANQSGKPSATTAKNVAESLGEDSDIIILDGGSCQTIPSTLLDMTASKPTILRRGKVPTDLLKQFLQNHHR